MAKASRRVWSGPDILPVVQAVSVRTLLIVHSTFTVWRTADVEGDRYWLLWLVNVGVLMEGIYTVGHRKGQEYTWFCPCLLLYLCSTLPAITLLELNRIHEQSDNTTSHNSTDADDRQGHNASQADDDDLEELSTFSGIRIPLKLEAETWRFVIEQSLPIVIVIGRWILPRGRISRTQLSILLFIYIGMASDITEMFVLFEEKAVRDDRILTYITLGVWSVSLIQFALVLTASRIQPVDIELADGYFRQLSTKSTQGCGFLDPEVRTLLIGCLLQDLPFLCVRLYAIVRHNVKNYSIYFFLSKNLLLIFSVLYRIIVMCCELQFGTGRKANAYVISDVEKYADKITTTPKSQYAIAVPARNTDDVDRLTIIPRITHDPNKARHISTLPALVRNRKPELDARSNAKRKLSPIQNSSETDGKILKRDTDIMLQVNKVPYKSATMSGPVTDSMRVRYLVMPTLTNMSRRRPGFRSRRAALKPAAFSIQL